MVYKLLSSEKRVYEQLLRDQWREVHLPGPDFDEAPRDHSLCGWQTRQKVISALPYGGANFFRTRSFSRRRSRNRGQLRCPIPRARNRRGYTPIPWRHCD
jgi:hypothetical protein